MNQQLNQQLNQQAGESEKKKISELLRSRDLLLKRIEKSSNKIVGYETVLGNAKPSEDLMNTESIFSSVYNLLENTCNVTAKLRRANVATQTSMKDYFGETMSVFDCRQNIVGDKVVGLPSASYHLKTLYNEILRQTQEVNRSVTYHNESHLLKLKKIQDLEYSKHEEERKSSREQNIQLPVDFESTYETKIKNIVDSFWLTNKAHVVDPLSVFTLLKNLSEWTDLFEKEREMMINKANNTDASFDIDMSKYTGEPDVSLEELSNLIKEKNSEIIKLIDRLVVVSWKIGETGLTNNILIQNAKENYDLIMKLIKSYNIMISAHRTASTFVLTTVSNSITNKQMSAVDMIDLKNIVVPIMKKMLHVVEQQKENANKHIKSQESEIRSEVVKLLESSMSSASSRPSSDKVKEYTNNLIDSVSPKLVSATNINFWIEKYQSFLDEFDSKIKPALSTINANTRVKTIWENNTVPKQNEDWDTVDLMESYEQLEIVNSIDLYGNNHDFEETGNLGIMTNSNVHMSDNVRRNRNRNYNKNGKGTGGRL